MTTTRYDFHGCPAYLKQVLGKYTCEAWLSKKKAEVYDPHAFVTLDLSLAPGNLHAAKVEIDDYVDAGGATTLGPCWPDSAAGDGYGHAAEGAVYLIEARWKEYDAKLLIEKPDDPDEKPWRTQVRVYVDRQSGKPDVLRRYYGFSAKARKIGDKLVTFDVYQLTDPLDQPGRQLTIELDNRKECDALDAAPVKDEEIGLFLEESFAGANGLQAGKIPRGLSGGRLLGGTLQREL